MSESKIFNEAKDAIKAGDNDRARDLLTRLLRSDKNNPEYWLWMSTVVFSKKEKIYCLKNVIDLDHENHSARQGLIILGGIPADDVKPNPQVKRDWETYLKDKELSSLDERSRNPVFRIVGILVIGIIWAGIMLGGIFGVRGLMPKLTITPIAWTRTPTNTSTRTPSEPTHTLVFTSTPVPLWMLLDATYTPTPIYVNTPHPRLEAYRLAIRSYGRADYTDIINYLEQTLQNEPEAVDLLYYMGEAYRGLADFETALQYFDDALLLDHNFAPAYLSRARIRQALNPKVDVYNDIEKAIDSDPSYGEAYYERGMYWYKANDFKSALSDLNIAVDLMPFDPRAYLGMAQVNIAQGNNEEALENALDANQLDITLLETYLILGKAYLINEMPEDGLAKIEIYGSYRPDDPLYLALLGGILYMIGEDYDSALTILDRAKSLDNDLVEAYYYHGLTSYELGDYNQAVNDFYIARNLMPGNLEYSVWFGIALYEDERYREAYNQFGLIDPGQLNLKQAARYYYYKAKSGMELSLIESVESAWMSLLELPEEFVPASWKIEAEEYLTPVTISPNPSATITLTITPIPEVSITKTPIIPR